MNYLDIYTDFLKRFLKIRRPLRVVFDCSNGTTGLILKELFKAKNSHLRQGPIKAVFINDSPNGNFPAHGPDPLKPDALKQLQATVKKQKADLGIIFDADGDRAFFIDNKARSVYPDIIARILIWYLKPKKLIIDVRTGWLIKKLKTKNLKLKTSRVGHYFIKKLMRKTKTDLAVEWSGHYYFKKFFYADSGILAAIEVINAVSRLPYQLSDFIDLLPTYYHSGELNFIVKDKEKLLKTIEKTYKNKARKISKIDGLTAEFNDYWFNLRASNTEPLVRLNIETISQKLANQKIKELKRIIVS